MGRASAMSERGSEAGSSAGLQARDGDPTAPSQQEVLSTQPLADSERPVPAAGSSAGEPPQGHPPEGKPQGIATYWGSEESEHQARPHYPGKEENLRVNQFENSHQEFPHNDDVNEIDNSNHEKLKGTNRCIDHGEDHSWNNEAKIDKRSLLISSVII